MVIIFIILNSVVETSSHRNPTHQLKKKLEAKKM